MEIDDNWAEQIYGIYYKTACTIASIKYIPKMHNNFCTSDSVPTLYKGG